MEITAKLIQILPPVTGQGKNGEWRKQNFIFETEGQYPKKVCISTWGDKINTSTLQVGNMVNVSFDLESREYNGNWYTDARAWRMEATGEANSSPQTFEASSKPGPTPVNFDQEDDGNDLPF